MKTDRTQGLIARREELAKHAAAMASTPEAERPTKAAELKAWLRELTQLQDLIEQFDSLIDRVAPKPRVGLPDLVPRLDPNTGEVVTVARVRKGQRAEIRVTVKPWQGRKVVDIRVWSQVTGQGEEMKPTRKGLAFDASKLDALIDALHQAKQHV